MDDHELDKVFETIAKGETIEHWLKGPVGQYIQEQKRETERKILEQFRNVDPHDAKAIMLLQRALDAADTGPRWLEEAVTTAQQHDQILRAEQDEATP